MVMMLNPMLLQHPPWVLKTVIPNKALIPGVMVVTKQKPASIIGIVIGYRFAPATQEATQEIMYDTVFVLWTVAYEKD